MAELIFSHGDNIILRYPLNSRSLRIGKSALNDLPFADIPLFLLSIERTPDGYTLMDRSEHGTLLNGIRVKTALLKDGDRMGLGPVTALFHEPAAASHTAPLPQGKTLAPRTFLELKDGRRLPVTVGGIRIGKSENNDLVLDDPHVSSLHAMVMVANGLTMVRDLGSTNGTFVNGARVVEAEAPPGSTIRFGQVSVRLVDSETVTPRPAASPLPGIKQVGALLYADPKMDAVAKDIRAAARSDAPVCIHGETGTGKELVARAVHELGPHSAEPFVALNCGALSPHLVESELFGHERGAFSGADRARKGAFEYAGKGTLFLDELGDLPLDAQVKLLRALDNQEIRRVGGNAVIKVQCRIITATHRNLRAMVQAGTFRADLMNRVAVLSIELPPLRERQGDIPLLVEHALRLYGNGRAVTVTEAAMKKLRAHPWSGNVRELVNALRAALARAEGDVLDASDLALVEPDLEERVTAARIYQPGRKLEELELDILEQALEVHGSKVAAAVALGIAESTVRAKLKRRG